ncbi:MAG: flagellar basal body P-ring formation protein FlgA, partial [Phycisphaerales bacterium]
VDLARSYLLKGSAANSACRLDVLKTPQDLVLDRTNDRVELVPRRIKTSTPNQASVAIAVFAGGREVGTREVSFRFKYKSRRAVALVAIPAGGVISPDNVKMEDAISSYPESPDRVVTYGMVAKRAIAANTVLRRTLVGPVEPPVALKRNQNVLIRIETLGLLVTAAGKTLQEGRTGECIRVRNIDSQRIIMAKIKNDGTVEPVY